MITRRAFVGSAAALAGSVRRAAADPIAYRDYSRCLPDYLTALATAAYRRRSERIAKLTTPRITRAYLARHLVSWRSIAESEHDSQPLANFVPDILRHTDLPQIARSMAPRPVIVAGAVDANGGLLRQAPYSEFREEPAWNFDALSRL